MTNVASVGVKFDGADLERGIRALDALAARGPAVESALSRVEGAAARTGRTLATLGQTGDLSGVNRQSDSAAAGINRLGQAAAQASASVSGLGAASNSAQNGLSRTAQGAASSAEAMRSAATSANVLSSAMSSIAAGFGAAQLIGITDGYTKFTAQIRMATTGATDYANAMASVKAISTTAQADIGAIGVLYARIASATGELGLSQKQLASITETVGLSLKASGATASESSSAMLQLSQAFGAGALRGEEFNAVNEAAPGLLKALAESMGKTTGELKKMAENGLLTSAAMAKAFSDPAVVADMQKKAAEVQTISGAFVVLKNEVMGFVGVSAQSSGAVKALTGGIESLAKNLDVLAGVGLTVTAVKLATWMEAGITATYAKVAANRALLAANLATAQSEATAAGAASVLAAARVAELRASVLAAEGNVALAITTNGLIPAQARAAVAADAHAVSLGALAVAQRAASASSALVGGALTLLGGPIGAIVTVLGLGATAWYMWGKSSEDASKQAAGAVEASTAEILANLDKQIEKAQRRLDLAKQGNEALAKAPGPESDRAATAQAEVNRLKALGSAITGAESIRLIEQQGIVDALTSKTQTLAAANASLAAIGSQSKSETWMAKYATDAEKMAAELKKARSELAAGSNELAEVEKRITAQYAAKAKGASGAAAAVKKEQSEYDKLVASIKTKIAQNDEEVKTGGKLNDAEKLRIKLQAEIEAGTRKSTAAHEAEAKALLKKLDVSEQALALSQAQKKFEGERDKEAQSIAAEIAKINEKAQALEDEAAAYGLGAAAIAQSTIERLEEKKAIIAAMDASSIAIQQIDDEIAARQRLGAAAEALAGQRLTGATDENLRNAQEMARLYQSELSTAGLTATQRKLIAEQRRIALEYAKKEAEIDKSGASESVKASNRRTLEATKQVELQQAAVEAQDAAWASMWESVDKTAHDVFVNVATDGMDAFKRIGQTLKASILDLLYQMTIKKWIVSIGASVTGGVGGMAQAAGTGAVGNIVGGASAMGGMFGSGLSAGLSAWANEAGLMGALDAGGIALGAGNIMGGLGTIAGALGPIALGVGAIVTLAKGFTSRGANHGGGIYSSAGLSDQDAAQSIAGNLGWEDPVTDFTTRGNAALSGQVKTAVDSLLEVYAGLGALAKGTVADLEVVAGFAVNGKHDDEDVYGYFQLFDKMTGELLSAYSNREMGKDGDAAWAQYVADLGGAMVSQLLDADIPSWMNTILTELGEAPTMDALTGAVAKIHTIDAAFGTFSATIDGFAGLTDKAREALMLAAGGIEGLSSSLGSYYAEYYSDAERLAHSTKAVGDVFADMGIAVPTTRAGLRKLVEEQLALGESGAKTAAELLKVAPAFAEVTKGAEAAQKQLLESVGINSADIATTIRDSMLGRIDGSEAGQKIAGMVTDGIYNAIAGGFANQITDLMTTSIISPVIQAAITGASITEAVSQGAIDNMVAQAQAAATALGRVLNNPAFKAAINSIGAAISGAVGGGGRGATGGVGDVYVHSNVGPSFGRTTSYDQTYGNQPARVFEQLASETIASNGRVSELLMELLKPKKDYETRYLELAEKLAQKQIEYGLGDKRKYVSDLQAGSEARKQFYLGVAPTMDQATNKMTKENLGELAKLLIASGRYDATTGNIVNGNGSLYGVPDGSIFAGIATDTESGIDMVSKLMASMYKATGDTLLDAVDFQEQIMKLFGITDVPEDYIGGKVADLNNLEKQLKEWYIAQARVIAVEDMAALSEETRAAKSKTEELKRTGGLEDPVTKLNESFASKIKAIDDSIGAALLDEVELLKQQKADPSLIAAIEYKIADAQSYLNMTEDEVVAWQDKLKSSIDSMNDVLGDPSIWIDGLWLPDTPTTYDIYKEYRDNYQKMLDSLLDGSFMQNKADDIEKFNQQMLDVVLAATEPAKQQALLDEIAKYKGGITEWYKAQADLLSTEMLIDINKQIKELEANEKGPLTTIKDAIQKYIDDFKALGTLTDDIQTQIDKLSGLQLTKARKSLYDQLLSPEELKTRSSDDLNVQFTGLGQAMPATTTALRDMIDAARAAGNITLADSLLELVPAFVSLQGAVDGVGDVLGNLRTATDDAYAALERAVGVQRDLLNETITHLQAVFDMTRDAARALYGEVESASQQSAAAGRAFIDNALANAQTTGYMPDADGLREAIEGVRKGIAAQQGVSTFESERDRLVLAGKLTDLKDIAEPQLTEAQRQLAALEEMLKTARTQIDELRGINVSVLSVADAMTALAAAIAAEKAQPPVTPPVPGGGGGAGGGAGGGGANSSINSIYQQLFGRDAETAGVDYWAGTGLTGAALVAAIAGGAINDDKLKLPGFATGINRVPYDMTARIHEGEAVVPARFNPFNPSARQNGLGGNTERLEALVEGLTAEVQRLQSIVAKGVEHQRETAEILDNVTEGGNAMRSEVMA